MLELMLMECKLDFTFQSVREFGDACCQPAAADSYNLYIQIFMLSGAATRQRSLAIIGLTISLDKTKRK